MKKNALLCFIMLFCTCGLVCAEQAFVSHRQHHQAPWVTDLMEHEITIDMGLSVDWGWTNVGAQSPEDPGWYIAWGETESKDTFDWSTYKLCEGTENSMTKYCRNSNFGTCDGISQLEPVDDVAYQKSADAHIPTDAEWQELLDNSKQILTEQDGTMGFLITSLLNGKSIFLPMGGYRSDISYSDDTDGYYWASTYNNCYPTNGQMVHLCNATNNVELSSIARFIGMNVRPVYQKAVPFNPNCAIAVFQNNLSFGNLSTGESKTLSFVIKNVTDKAVTINSLPSSGNTRYGTYSLNWTGGVIDAGKFQKVNVTIKAEDPTEEDNYSFKISYQGMPEGAEITISCTASIYAKDEPSMSYVDLGLPSGTLWADRNVGAVTVSDIGDRYAWGETEPKKYYDWGTYSDTQDEGNTFSKYYLDGGMSELAPADDAATSRCGREWHTPTSAQLQELIDCCDWKVTKKAGQSGIEIVGTNGNSIFLPDPGSYQDDRWPMVAGSFAYYWTRTLSNTDSQKALSLYFSYSSWSDIDGDSGTDVKPSICLERRCWGQVIRPVHEAAKEERAITVTPTTLDFGRVKVGESKALDLTITNYCDSSIFVSIMAESFGNYSLSWNGDSIQKKTKQTVHVIYTSDPEIDGDSLQLLVRWNGMDDDEPIVVDLLGQCADTNKQSVPFFIEPLLLDFSQMVIGETKAITLCITNQSYETQQVLDFSQNMPNGIIIDWTGGEIGPRSTKEVNVAYTAVQELPLSSYGLTISNENMIQESSSIIVPIWISAKEPPAPVYAIAASPEELIFEKVAVGEAQTKVLTVCNNTHGEVAVRDFSCNNEQFTMDWEGGTLLADEIRAVHVTYAPKEMGKNSSAKILLATTEMAANDESIAVSVKGTAANMPAYETAKTHLVLRNKDGSRVAFILAERPKVSFAEDKIFIETTRLSTHYDSDSFQRFTYETEEDILSEIIQHDVYVAPFSLEREQLNFVPGAKDLNVRVITANGTVIQQLIVHKGEILSLPLDLFETGVYLIEVNGEIYKLFLR